MSATAIPAPVDRAPLISRATRRRTVRVIVYALLILVAMLFLIPVYMVLVTSFKPFDQVSLSSMWEFPREFTLDGFRDASYWSCRAR
jgi:ABC-type glycerol-3-phosphate transport system permease component